MNGLACWRVTLCVDGTMFCHPVTRCDPVHYDDISVPRAVYPDMIAFLAGREDIIFFNQDQVPRSMRSTLI